MKDIWVKLFSAEESHTLRLLHPTLWTGNAQY